MQGIKYSTQTPNRLFRSEEGVTAARAMALILAVGLGGLAGNVILPGDKPEERFINFLIGAGLVLGGSVVVRDIFGPWVLRAAANVMPAKRSLGTTPEKRNFRFIAALKRYVAHKPIQRGTMHTLAICITIILAAVIIALGLRYEYVWRGGGVILRADRWGITRPCFFSLSSEKDSFLEKQGLPLCY